MKLTIQKIDFTEGKLKLTCLEELNYTDFDFYINRADFEDYITGNTGIVEYVTDAYEPVTGHKQKVDKMLIKDYWLYDTDIKTDVLRFIKSKPELYQSFILAYNKALIIETVLDAISMENFEKHNAMRKFLYEALYTYEALAKISGSREGINNILKRMETLQMFQKN